ncbi:hypothetical protein CI104_14920 [Citrobacter farmeri]|uniref:Uncharacterized protein n=1 Tax=Citrobacter farmeri TaxID=67824 RepID=A0ACA8D7U4_9ENTR|nr:hypothetical protein CI104_14920 [Citrobacter farmeri]
MRMLIKFPEKVFELGQWWYRTAVEFEIDGIRNTAFFYSLNRYDAACRLTAIKENGVLGSEDTTFIDAGDGGNL